MYLKIKFKISLYIVFFSYFNIIYSISPQHLWYKKYINLFNSGNVARLKNMEGKSFDFNKVGTKFFKKLNICYNFTFFPQILERGGREFFNNNDTPKAWFDLIEEYSLNGSRNLLFIFK